VVALVRQEALDHLGAREALVHLEALGLLAQVVLLAKTETLVEQLLNMILQLLPRCKIRELVH